MLLGIANVIPDERGILTSLSSPRVPVNFQFSVKSSPKSYNSEQALISAPRVAFLCTQCACVSKAIHRANAPFNLLVKQRVCEKSWQCSPSWGVAGRIVSTITRTASAGRLIIEQSVTWSSRLRHPAGETGSGTGGLSLRSSLIPDDSKEASCRSCERDALSFWSFSFQLWIPCRWWATARKTKRVRDSNQSARADWLDESLFEQRIIYANEDKEYSNVLMNIHHAWTRHRDLETGRSRIDRNKNQMAKPRPSNQAFIDTHTTYAEQKIKNVILYACTGVRVFFFSESLGENLGEWRDVQRGFRHLKICVYCVTREYLFLSYFSFYF